MTVENFVIVIWYHLVVVVIHLDYWRKQFSTARTSFDSNSKAIMTSLVLVGEELNSRQRRGKSTNTI
jgi:hypothetical protein